MYNHFDSHYMIQSVRLFVGFTRACALKLIRTLLVGVRDVLTHDRRSHVKMPNKQTLSGVYGGVIITYFRQLFNGSVVCLFSTITNFVSRHTCARIREKR